MYRVASLFAGVGGIDLGFEKTGQFKTVWANEYDKNARLTYLENFSANLNEQDIREVNVNEIPEIDVLLSGFPCTSFSIAGYRKGFEDENTGDLFFETLRIIIAKKPRVIFLENVKNLVSHDEGKTFKIIKEAGIVGLGGAQFPTHIKYDIKFRKVETFIINGAECEPYLTSDYSVMKNYTSELFRGLKVIQKLLNPKEMIIGIEEENSELIEIFEKIGKEEEFDLKIQLLPTIYPQGSELQLINTVTGKKVRKGELPLEQGVVVSNVSTVKAIYDAFFEGKPLIERVVTVSGEEARNIGNYKIKFGTPLYHIVKELDIWNEEKVIFGGPMMGMEIFDSRVPVIKGTSGILFLSPEEIERKNCISCGYCVEACPMNLMPFEFADYYEKGKYEQMVTANIQNCIECGACEYVCPSRVPLIESIKTGKAILSEMEANK